MNQAQAKAPATKPITSLPNNRPKNKESLEIAALTAEFLARGGQIKRAKGNQLHVAMNPFRALSNGEVAAKLPATMYDQAVTVLKALEVDASLFLSQQRDREKEFLRQDRTLLTQRVQMALPLQQTA